MKTVSAFSKTFSAPSTPIAKIEIAVDFDELRKYIKQEFEKRFGEGIVVEVEATKSSPYEIGVAVYVKEKKDGMWPLCIEISDELGKQGIQAGIYTELAKEVLNEI